MSAAGVDVVMTIGGQRWDWPPASWAIARTRCSAVDPDGRPCILPAGHEPADVHHGGAGAGTWRAP